MKDPRVDPASNNQCVIKAACQAGDTIMVTWLLTQKTIDPSVDNQLPLRLEKFSHSNSEDLHVKMDMWRSFDS